jgi:hypothetical protein
MTQFSVKNSEFITYNEIYLILFFMEVTQLRNIEHLLLV